MFHFPLDFACIIYQSKHLMTSAITTKNPHSFTKRGHFVDTIKTSSFVHKFYYQNYSLTKIFLKL